MAHPRLCLLGRLNLADTLFELGRIQEALDLLAYDWALHRAHADGATDLRRRWLLGRMALARGRPGEAREVLVAVQGGFAERGVAWDAALVSLDLALVYLDLGEPGRARQAGEFAHRVFLAHEVHPPALAGLELLARASRITRAAVRETIGVLRHGQRFAPLRASRPN